MGTPFPPLLPCFSNFYFYQFYHPLMSNLLYFTACSRLLSAAAAPAPQPGPGSDTSPSCMSVISFTNNWTLLIFNCITTIYLFKYIVIVVILIVLITTFCKKNTLN
ncbi:hypothetical protein JZ751_023804 [Albula glossodonta]|uniref:Uncharacterized protein n=1 Tax=Albula glossodonta TaxID=121402 RepID=A0A8T2NJF8_9TELE|nr:hypothetical protein JZ751_023804 [Albula glossodonta]